MQLAEKHQCEPKNPPQAKQEDTAWHGALGKPITCLSVLLDSTEADDAESGKWLSIVYDTNWHQFFTGSRWGTSYMDLLPGMGPATRRGGALPLSFGPSLSAWLAIPLQ